MVKQYKIIAIEPANAASTMNQKIEYLIQYKKKPNLKPEEFWCIVDFPLMLGRQIARKFDDAAIKKVVWENTRQYFEKKMLAGDYTDGMIKYPNILTYEDYLDKYDLDEVDFPIEKWTEIKTTIAQNHIFISCGQGKEAALGKQIVKIVEELTEYEGYFADNQSTNDAIINNIYKKLDNPAAVIVIMHYRGEVHTPDNKPFHRASVWCEQETAIVAFQSLFGKEIPVRIYAQDGIPLEGLRLFLPKTIYFENNEEVIKDVCMWLKNLPASKPRQLDIAKLQSNISETLKHWQQMGTPVSYLQTAGLNDDEQMAVLEAAFKRKYPQRKFDENEKTEMRKKLKLV